MKTVVMDMDDFYIDPANGMNWLFYLKAKYPTFKVTLFTIPLRSTVSWLREVKQLDWIELAVHGFQHDEEETFNLSAAQMNMYLDAIEETNLYTKGFKGANWKVSEELIAILKQRGYWLAVKEKIVDQIPQWPLTDERAIHGHIWMMETHNKEGILEFKDETDFRFISEVISKGGE